MPTLCNVSQQPTICSMPTHSNISHRKPTIFLGCQLQKAKETATSTVHWRCDGGRHCIACQDFIQQSHDIGRRFDYRDKTFRDCDCVTKLTIDDIQDGSIFLVDLVNQEKALRDTQLKGMMVAANQNHLATQQLRRKFWQTTTTFLNNDGVFLDYQLPFFGKKIAVCRRHLFFQLLFCSKPDSTKWKTLCDSLKKDGTGPRKHGLTGNNNNSGISPCEPDLRAFL